LLFHVEDVSTLEEAFALHVSKLSSDSHSDLNGFVTADDNELVTGKLSLDDIAALSIDSRSELNAPIVAPVPPPAPAVPRVTLSEAKAAEATLHRFYAAHPPTSTVTGALHTIDHSLQVLSVELRRQAELDGFLPTMLGKKVRPLPKEEREMTIALAKEDDHNRTSTSADILEQPADDGNVTSESASEAVDSSSDAVETSHEEESEIDSSEDDAGADDGDKDDSDSAEDGDDA
jgi:hypothetical protein